MLSLFQRLPMAWGEARRPDQPGRLKTSATNLARPTEVGAPGRSARQLAVGARLLPRRSPACAGEAGTAGGARRVSVRCPAVSSAAHPGGRPSCRIRAPGLPKSWNCTPPKVAVLMSPVPWIPGSVLSTQALACSGCAPA